MQDHDEEPEEILCNSCGEWKLEEEMSTSRLCYDCKEDEDREYEDSFRYAFN